MPGLIAFYLISLLFGVSFIAIISVGWYFIPLTLTFWAFAAFLLMKAGQRRLERIDF